MYLFPSGEGIRGTSQAPLPLGFTTGSAPARAQSVNLRWVFLCNPRYRISRNPKMPLGLSGLNLPVTVVPAVPNQATHGAGPPIR